MNAKAKRPAPPRRDVEEDVEPENLLGERVEAYPIDKLLVRTEPRTLQDVLRRIERGAFQLNPDFQREFLWDEATQSRLIESILMRIPLPVFYLAETDAALVVVDGQQRLTTCKRFKKNQLKLKLKRKELDGKAFSELPIELQDRFEDCQLTFYLIDKSVPERVRLDIFERVNSGVPLTRQQMRNALYNGPATRLLRELADDEAFQRATCKSLSSPKARREMKDREAINRFVAYYLLGANAYGSGPEAEGEYDDFLAAGLKAANALDDNKLDVLRKAFLRSMKVNATIFGDNAFRKPARPSGARNALNLALFEVFSVGLAKHPMSAQVSNNAAPKIERAMARLVKEDRFSDAISYATTRADNVRTRFRRTEEMLAKVLDVP
jgi:hypothetical protein